MKEHATKPRTSSEDVIRHAKVILKLLKLPAEVESKTMYLIEQASKHDLLTSCSSIGVAAGLIYSAGILTGNPTTLVRIAEKAGISSETIRKCKTRIVNAFKKMGKWNEVS